jgi:hypothetical protein
MKYRAILNFDYTNVNSNDFSRLKLALVEAHWLHVETSAFTIETTNLGEIWQGIELVAKQSSSAGELSALTFHIQGSDDFSNSVPIASGLKPANAFDVIKAKPFPTP